MGSSLAAPVPDANHSFVIGINRKAARSTWSTKVLCKYHGPDWVNSRSSDACDRAHQARC